MQRAQISNKKNEGIVTDLIKSSKKNNVCEMNAYLNQKLHTFQWARSESGHKRCVYTVCNLVTLTRKTGKISAIDSRNIWSPKQGVFYVFAIRFWKRNTVLTNLNEKSGQKKVVRSTRQKKLVINNVDLIIIRDRQASHIHLHGCPTKPS